MAGRLAREAPHLDGSEPIGVWFDVAWACYADLLKDLDRTHLDVIEETWDDINAEFDTSQPTMENWGRSEKAQQGQAALMSMFGGGGAFGADGGASPGVGEG